jgi:hypothetical protein
MKFYVLCSANLKAVQRHLDTIPKEDIYYVFNSQDAGFIAEVTAWCDAEGLPYSVTESDGTPATGKNSVLQVFTESDNEYMVLVDGDDFITPHGVWTYKHIAESGNAPDVIALEYQYGIYADRGYLTGWVNNPYLGCSDPNNHNQIQAFASRCFLQPLGYWEKAIAGTLVSTAIGTEFARELADVHHRWSLYAYHYINNWETHCRVVFYSKDAAQFRFDNALLIGEDTLQYFALKNEHVNGRLTMKVLMDRYPTYVYDTRIGGVCSDGWHDVGARGWKEWLDALVAKYEEYDSAGLMHTDKLPNIQICTQWGDPTAEGWDVIWPDGYQPDVMNLVNFPGPVEIWWDANAGAPVGSHEGNNHLVPRA